MGEYHVDEAGENFESHALAFDDDKKKKLAIPRLADEDRAQVLPVIIKILLSHLFKKKG